MFLLAFGASFSSLVNRWLEVNKYGSNGTYGDSPCVGVFIDSGDFCRPSFSWVIDDALPVLDLKKRPGFSVYNLYRSLQLKMEILLFTSLSDRLSW